MKILRYLLIAVIAFIFVSMADVSYAQDTAKIIFTSATPNTEAGQTMLVNVVVDSSVPVNAVEARIAYPGSKFKLLSVNYANSQFSIQAQESSSNGNVTIVRGNVVPRTGKNLLATLVFESTADGDIDDFSYSDTSLVMSSDKNENILTGSDVATRQPPATPKITSSYSNPATNFKQRKVVHKSFFDFLIQRGWATFHSFFRRQ